jgi:hypothetical protein
MRRSLILGLGVVLAMLTVGCGSETNSPSQSEVQSSEETEVASTPPSTEESQPEVGGPLSYVGTITGSGEGTTFSDVYSLGPLLYSKEGTPPEAVLNACHFNNSTTIASSVFARGQLIIKYEEGSLPTEVGITSWENIVKGNLAAVVAFRADGEWQCRGIEEEFFLEFQPGESQTLPIWLTGYERLSNAQPRVPASVLNTWYFNYIGQPLGNQGRLTIHGPGAGWCEEEFNEEERLLLYNRSGSC